MPILKPNHRQILAAKPIDGKKTRYRIEGVPGLWLYVSPTGVRTWYARYQIGSGGTRCKSRSDSASQKRLNYSVALPE